MLIHLEAGNCTNYDYVGRQFVRFVDLSYNSSVDYSLNKAYTCGSCDKDFVLVSGLFQHIESNTCGPDGEVLGDFEGFLRG